MLKPGDVVIAQLLGVQGMKRRPTESPPGKSFESWKKSASYKLDRTHEDMPKSPRVAIHGLGED